MSSPMRSDIIAGRKPPQSLGVARRMMRRSSSSSSAPAPYLPGLLAHPSTCPMHRPTLAAQRRSLRAPGSHGVERRFRAAGSGCQGSHVLATRNHYYWNDAATHLDAVRYLHIADENAELTRYRAGELHITCGRAARPVRLDPGESCRASCTSPRSSTPTTTASISPRALQGPSGLRRALSLVIDREKLVETRAARRRAARLRLGAAGGHMTTPRSHSTIATRRCAERIAEARRLYAAGGLFGAQAAALRAALQRRRSPHQARRRGRLDVEGGAGRRRALDRGGVQIAAAGYRSAAMCEMFRSSWVGDYNDAYTFAQYLKSDFGINLPHYQQSRNTTRCLAQAASRSDRRGGAGCSSRPNALMLARPSADAALFLRQQAPGEAGGRGLVRQRDERRLQQGSFLGRWRAVKLSAPFSAGLQPAHAGPETQYAGLRPERDIGGHTLISTSARKCRTSVSIESQVSSGHGPVGQVCDDLCLKVARAAPARAALHAAVQQQELGRKGRVGRVGRFRAAQMKRRCRRPPPPRPHHRCRPRYRS